MIDIPLSRTFYKWLLKQDNTIDITDLKYVDSVLHQSINQLYNVCLEKKRLENDATYSKESLSLALHSLTLDGMSIEDLGLDFVLPGTNIDLKKNGKDILVTVENLEEYLSVSAILNTIFCISCIFRNFYNVSLHFFFFLFLLNQM